MLVLIDLDGTLTDTAHEKFKPLKDGLEETLFEEIPIIKGACEFISKLQHLGHKPLIISDSHPRYVNEIAEKIFKIPALSLADKPNPEKTLAFINSNWDKDIKSSCIVIGDTWLDIELGRALNCPTILSSFYIASSKETRDGIGQDWKPLKSGPTFYVKTFTEIFEILENPEQNLLAVEAIFQNRNSSKAVKFKTIRYGEGFIAYRTLGRQNAGECDRFGVADKYFEFQRADRTAESLKKLAKATSNYLDHISQIMPSVKWDFFTYVSDKRTTQPPNKLKEFFELVETPISKVKIICWKDVFEGSIREQKDYKSRKAFVSENIFIDSKAELRGKNIIIIDDQFTTGGTAASICDKFRDLGVMSMLFITLFYLITTVESQKLCPHCGKKLQVKVNRSKGTRFISCVAPKYGGKGCGNYIQNII